MSACTPVPEINEAAHVFVAALAPANQDLLAKNIAYTTSSSDAMKALKEALTHAWNDRRQEEIRTEQERARKMPRGLLG